MAIQRRGSIAAEMLEAAEAAMKAAWFRLAGEQLVSCQSVSGVTSADAIHLSER